MEAELLCLLFLRLCLGYENEEKNDKLPRPFLSAWPSSVVRPKSNVTLQCWTHFQNVTVMLGKVHDSEYQQEQSSVGREAEFPLTDLQPEDAGGYFCAYKTAASLEWSRRSQNLQLVVTGSLQEPSLSVKSTSTMTPGHRTLHCLIPSNGSECFMIALLKTGIPEPLQTKKERNNQTDFMLWNVTSKDSGNYSCIHYQCNWPHLGSSPSHSLQIWVTDEPSVSGTPSLKTDRVGGDEGNPPEPADTGRIFLATFSCLCISLLFISIFLIYRCTQRGSSHEESPKR
ncbi:V-set and transmembrane domain-containing protein 1 [Nannospalax galili]|uniref:V-set and transmembrane domain-containing protein 1 n=1 Tax=Nannospalax galili TaxID=1026970 RepID=UPI00111C5D46|nr:V-set and transmembrane domain-containing protein 1 [Nannospalax galili]